MRFIRLRALRLFAVALVALGTVLAGLIGGPQSAPVAHAGGSCSTSPCIHWDSSMIYAGQNNGYPEGPVGEHATVHGEGFGAEAGVTVDFQLVQGDVNSTADGEFCKLAGPKVAIPGTAVVSGTGTFDFSFDWPAAASSNLWSICAYRDADHSTIFNIDDGPFSVLSPNPVSISISPSTVTPGGSVTVTGHNFVPPQVVHVIVAACVNCDGAAVLGTAEVTSSGLHDGTFSVTIPIRSDAAPGAYKVGAFSDNSVLDTGPSGAQSLTVQAAPTATPSPTATMAPTATTIPAASPPGGSGDGNSTMLLIVLVLVVIVLLAALAGLLVYLLTRRTPPGGGASAGGRPTQPPAGVAPGGYSQSPFGAPYAGPPTPPTPDWRNAGETWTPGGTVMYPTPGDDSGAGGTDGAAQAVADDAPTLPGNIPPDKEQRYPGY